jgi:DNA-binding MarR family transcriptional regulator
MLKQKADPKIARSLALAGELRVLIGQLKRRLRDQVGLGDLTWSQVSVLSHLEREGPATVTALARIEGVRPQSMGATISTLEAEGLVSGAPDPNDKRQTILSLTDKCRDWIKAARAASEDWLFRSIQENFNAEEQAELAHAVTLLKRLVDPP